MTSSPTNRNPKDLRELINRSRTDFDNETEDNQQDQSIVKKSLKNLKNFSNEDKTEIGILKSKIDEQSRLIANLKQKSDEQVKKIKAFEKQNIELQNKTEIQAKELNLSEVKYKELLGKLGDVTQNLEIAVASKNEIEAKLTEKNDQLTVKNYELLEKLSHLPTEAEIKEERTISSEKIEALNQKSLDLEVEIKRLRRESQAYANSLSSQSGLIQEKNEQINEINEKLKKSAEENDSLALENKKLAQNLTQIEQNFKIENEKNLKRISELNKEKYDIVSFCETVKSELKTSIENHMLLEKKFITMTQELKFVDLHFFKITKSNI
jgi:hypothetical protein